MKVRVVELAFPPGLDDEDDMADMFLSLKLATNIVLGKVNMDKILHAASTLNLWDVSVVQVVLICGIVCEVLFACMSTLTFVELCIRWVKLC
jgi:hypothetical protein